MDVYRVILYWLQSNIDIHLKFIDLNENEWDI